MIDIMLVDDETYVTESLAKTIPWAELGIRQVIQASSAAEALLLMERQPVDILVTDIRMPDMSGLQLIEKVAQQWPNVRCMLLTGHSDFEYAKRAIQLQAFDYILKPVDDDEFVVSLTNAIESLKDEWEQAEKFNKLVYYRKADIAVLRSSLLRDLLLGRRLSAKASGEKLALYEIPLRIEDSAVMMLIQLGRRFAEMDHHSISLMEYAVGNIAEEVFGGQYDVWHGKAPHDCLVLIASLKPETEKRLLQEQSFEKARRAELEEAVRLFRRHVENYLKGGISLVITEWFTFPDDVSAAYRAGLGAIGTTEGEGTVFLEDAAHDRRTARSLDALYKPPTLIHLLESKQWDAAGRKIAEVFDELEKSGDSREHLYEVYFSVSNAFMYVVHKQGHYMHQIDHAGLDLLADPGIVLSVGKLRAWAAGMLEKLRRELSASDKHARSYIVSKVQELVSRDLGGETSVKTIADRVYLHPVYLSKIYKAETGESLGDYIIRMRMERALYLLKHTNKKIYEITAELGYQNPQYFSKMFKKHYGLAPNEFRDP